MDTSPNPAEDKYTVTVDGPGLTLDRSVPAAVAKQVIMVVMSGQMPFPDKVGSGRSHGNTGDMTPDVGGGSPPLSIGEFVEAADPKRNPDKITAIAVFLRRYRDMEVFSPSDIVSAFEESGERAPGNISRDIRWAVSNNWIAPKRGERGSYFVTNSGIEAVEKKFPKKLIKKTTVPGSRKRSNNNDSEEQE